MSAECPCADLQHSIVRQLPGRERRRGLAVLRRRGEPGKMWEPIDCPQRRARPIPVGRRRHEATEIVAISLSHGAAARVEGWIRLLPAPKPQGRRKRQLIEHWCAAAAQRCHLPERVHTGVGPGGAVHGMPLAEQRPQRALERALHRRHARLLLPAAERGAVILEQQGKSVAQAVAGGGWRSRGRPAPNARSSPPGNRASAARGRRFPGGDRKSTRLNSSHGYISYAVFCLKKKKKTKYE